ncbi:DUF6445 family protein [Catenovulum sp. 2E275]|uniref:DUF6445 family protein n=1 Tax=Catenovulum sp. 2E275 TaxID=2980497 RepID=UPI0021CE3EAF|nr:DUF6445 family protein [Catenovulum sp. 2E275]MCU4675892.1 DUF6445 family protein [Catenovulum sp. 2E275]
MVLAQTDSIINFSLHPAIKWHVLQIGVEKTPVILVDNFLADINMLRQFALTADFQQEKITYYPGVRAPLVNAYIDFVLNQLAPVISKIYQLKPINMLAADQGFYSLVNKKAKNLNKHQCIPHFDSLNKRQFAIMHYLNSGEFGGTGFYRHLPTGFEHIEQDNLALYQMARTQFEYEHGQPDKTYINQSTDEFKLLGKIAYKLNRLVVYPGTLLHSGLIQQADLSSDPNKGRLTANIFAEVK